MKKSLTLLLIALVSCLGLKAQTVPTPTQTDEIIMDNGTSGKADPGDKIRYKVTIQNTHPTTPATGVQLNVVPDIRTTVNLASFRTTPLALPDAYSSIGNVGITVPDGASDLLANDFDDLPGSLTIMAVSNVATTAGGSITINANGSFSYNPPRGFEGADTYQYTLIDGNDVDGAGPIPGTDLGTVTFNVSGMIWFVNNNAGACVSSCDGRLTNPYTSLSTFNTANALAGGLDPDNNDNIFIYESAAAYTSGIVLRNGQKLFGQDATATLAAMTGLVLPMFSNALPTTSPGGTLATITNGAGDGVTLADGNTLRGFTVGNCSDFGIDNSGILTVGNLVVSEVTINNGTGGGFDASNGSGASMNAVFTAISSTGGVNGIDLTSCLGTFTVNGGTITNPTGTGVQILNGSVAFSSSGVITDNTGFAVDVDNHDSGNATFSGNITSTGTGIRVQNCGGGIKTFSGASQSLTTAANKAVTLSSNTGATINFTGGALVISTTTATGFDATGGGIVNVTGANNTIASTTGSPLNIVNTTIGVSNVTFKSIACNGASNGIVLNNTGVSGGLSVTGTGVTNGSGGTIQNITNRGVSAITTINLSLKNMTFTNANTSDVPPVTTNAVDNSLCNAAIHMNTVTNAILDNVDINGTAQQGINIKEVNGLQLLNSTVINGGAGGQTEEADFYALNLYGTCAITSCSLTVPAERAAVIYNTNKTLVLTVTSSVFGMNQAQPLGADGLEVNSYMASNTTLDIVNCTFVQPKTNGLQVITENTSVSSVDIIGSTFDPGLGLAAAIDLDVNNTADMKFNIINNPSIKGKGINIINVFAFPDATFEGRINDNTVISNGGSGSGIRVHSTGNGNSKVEIKNNTVSGITADLGIDIQNQGGTSRMDATVTDNDVTITATAGRAIQIVAGGSGDVFTNKICANVANNVTVAPMGAIGHYQERAEQNLHEILLQGGGTAGATAVATNWNANMNSPMTPTAIISQSGTGIFTILPIGQTCAIPTNPTP